MSTFLKCSASIAIIAAFSATGAQPALAHSDDSTGAKSIEILQSRGSQQVGDAFDRFSPKPSASPARLDYSFWDEALSYMVLSMGVSTREGASRPNPGIGSRRIYGHDSRMRLEGNRVVFGYLTANEIAPLSEYRADLERIGGEIDIASLPRDEQLAYWMNLHNVAVTEQIGLNYPMRSPSRLKLGPDATPLDETPFITVGGVSMSPKDIRTKIVFPNWDDPRVIYGFFRGEIGGPSIRRRAFTGSNVQATLAYSANEFVNSLRGVEKWGSTMMVSKIYDEAAPFYFPDYEQDLRAHLAVYAEDEVKDVLGRTTRIKTNTYVDDIADLQNGVREPSYSYVETGTDLRDTQGGRAQSTRVPQSVARLLNERIQKLETLRRQGRLGRVIVLPVEQSRDETTAESNTTPNE